MNNDRGWLAGRCCLAVPILVSAARATQAAETPRFNFLEKNKLRIEGPGFRPSCLTSPAVADWNGDGVNDLILLVGDGKGRIRIFNYDSGKREFSGAGCLSSDKGEIQIRPKSRPWIMDWNQDGRSNLVIIGPDDDNVYCYLNAP